MREKGDGICSAVWRVVYFLNLGKKLVKCVTNWEILQKQKFTNGIHLLQYIVRDVQLRHCSHFVVATICFISEITDVVKFKRQNV